MKTPRIANSGFVSAWMAMEASRRFWNCTRMEFWLKVWCSSSAPTTINWSKSVPARGAEVSRERILEIGDFYQKKNGVLRERGLGNYGFVDYFIGKLRICEVLLVDILI
jgi:hypothetical protein